MQYILTEDEYRALTETKRKRDEAETAELQRLCTLVAEHAPSIEWPGSKENPRPNGCPITGKYAYCSGCQAREMCPNPHKRYGQ